MNEGTPRSIMADSNNLNGSQRRRSPRLSSSSTDNKMALPAVAVKRSINVRKIAPRKTVAPSDHNKENTPRRSEVSQQKKLKVSTPGPAPDRGLSSSGKKVKKKAAMPSPILPISSPPPPPPPQSHPQQPAVDADDAVWSQKVRRSYSRLSDASLNSPDSRDTMFGFEKLQTPEVCRRVGLSKTAPEVFASLSGLNSFTSFLDAAGDCTSSAPDLDTNIPGVAVVKEKRRRKKVQQIGSTELEELAAKMNAEFEEAEEFELIVE